MVISFLPSFLPSSQYYNPITRLYTARRIAINVVSGIGLACGLCEKIAHALDWTHPEKSEFLMFAALAGAVLTYFLPWRFLVLALVFHQFTKLFRRKKGDAPKTLQSP